MIRRGGIVLLKRIVAVASSLVMTAGTTPLSYADSAVNHRSFAPQPARQPLAGKGNRLTVTGWTGAKRTEPISDDLSLIRKYHYAVKNTTVVPILQEQSTPTTLRPSLARPLKKVQTDMSVPRSQPSLATASKPKVAVVTSHPTQTGNNPPEQVTKESKSAPSSRAGQPEAVHQLSGLGREVARMALHLVGSTYRFGGDSSSGFDCSGLVQYVYQKAGVVMPRTSYQQFEVGRPVSLHDLRPGDLLFFSTYRSGPSHVAIYVGNGMIVQALNSQTGVVVSHLSKEYYRTHYVGARRP